MNISERKKQLSKSRKNMFPMTKKETEDWYKNATKNYKRCNVYESTHSVYWKLHFDFSDVYSATQEEKIKMGNQFVKNIFRLCFMICNRQKRLLDAREKYCYEQELHDDMIALYKEEKDPDRKENFFLCMVYDAYYSQQTRISNIKKYIIEAVITMAMYFEFLDMNNDNINDIHVLTDILDGDPDKAVEFIGNLLRELDRDCSIEFDTLPKLKELSALLKRIYSFYMTVVDNGGWDYPEGTYVVCADGSKESVYLSKDNEYNICTDFLVRRIKGTNIKKVYGEENDLPDGYYNPVTGELIIETPTMEGWPERKYPLLLGKKIKKEVDRMQAEQVFSETFRQFGMEMD